MPFTFFRPINDASATLARDHLVSDGVLVVDDAAPFGTPSPAAPIKVVANNGSAMAAFRVESISGNTLAIAGMVEGTADISLARGTAVDVRLTAGDIADLQDAISSNAGVGDLSYVHSQLSAAATWTIVHNLNKFPSVSIADSAGSLVVGEVDYVSPTTVVVSFGSPFGGTAYLN